MENLKKELQQAIMERFKQSQIAKALEQKLREHIEQNIFEKYKETKIKRDNLEYKLFAVKCYGESNHLNFKIREVNTELIYIITSDIKAEHKKELQKAKRSWENDGCMGWYDRKKIKVKLWIEESYEISIDKIINNEINLKIDGKII